MSSTRRSNYDEYFCPYCGYTFPASYPHAPCPEPIGDTHPNFGVPFDKREENYDEDGLIPTRHGRKDQS